MSGPKVHNTQASVYVRLYRNVSYYLYIIVGVDKKNHNFPKMRQKQMTLQ